MHLYISRQCGILHDLLIVYDILCLKITLACSISLTSWCIHALITYVEYVMFPLSKSNIMDALFHEHFNNHADFDRFHSNLKLCIMMVARRRMGFGQDSYLML